MAAAPSAIATERGFHSVGVGEKKAEMKKADQHDYSGLVRELRDTFNTGKTEDLAWRKQQLEQLKLLISENIEIICKSFMQDHAGPKIRSFMELAPFESAQFAIDNLDKWAAPEVVPHKGANPLDALRGKSYIQKKPKGVALVIAPWNYPIALTLDCMVSCICAGNCVVVKPSEVSVNSCSILEKLIPRYFDQSAIRIVSGGVAETTALLREQFDHIMYTGNGAVARIVMKAAANHLTPCTLELGGKSPTFVDKSAKLDVAVTRIGGGKWINAGQTCIAPDYVLVHKDVAKEFTAKIKEQVKAYYGESADAIKKNANYGRIINSRHVDRISSLLNTKGEVVAGGESDPASHYYAPTIVANPSLDDAVMQEEIFGPVLPIIVVDSVQDAVKKVNTICNKPLALYIFAEDQATIDYYLNHTTSGGVCVNSTVEHIANPHLPFGGIGESGMGSYHGIHGFNELSHHRSVFVKDTMLQKSWILPGPQSFSDDLFDLAVKAQITGFLTQGQKTMMKIGGAAVAGLVAYKLSTRL